MKSIALLLALACPFSALAEEKAHPTPPAAKELPDGSIYSLQSIWTNQQGQKIEWAKGSGKARVLAMGYSTCKGICPRIIADMQRLEKELSADQRKKVTFTFLSVAPETDKVEQLKALVDNHKLNNDTWQVMRSDPDSVLELAVALGIQYTLLPNGVDYAHSYLIAIISPEGKVLHKWADSSEAPDRALQVLRATIPKTTATSP